MSFRISTNVASLAAQRNLGNSQRATEKALLALSSGSRINRASDDAAGFAIAESLRGQLSGVKQAKKNADTATSFIQTAEGGLSEQNNILIRLRELAVYSASDTVGDEERGYLNMEFQQLSAEFDRIARSTRYGNKQLLTGNGDEHTFQIGAYRGEENEVSFKLDANTTASEVGISGLSIDDQDSATDVLEDLDEGLQKVASARASFGAMQSRLQHASDHLAVQIENVSAARSQIVDADIAEEAANLAQNQIIQDAGIAVLAQANVNTSRVARLIQ
ncbi:MAG: flagellin [Bdellovibrionales bacterium]